MKTGYQKVIRREDGSRVRIEAEVFEYRYGHLEYRVKAFLCKKRKRTWLQQHDTEDGEYRKLGTKERDKFIYDKMLTIVTEEEIHQAKLELWHSLKP